MPRCAMVRRSAWAASPGDTDRRVACGMCLGNDIVFVSAPLRKGERREEHFVVCLNLCCFVCALLQCWRSALIILSQGGTATPCYPCACCQWRSPFLALSRAPSTLRVIIVLCCVVLYSSHWMFCGLGALHHGPVCCLAGMSKLNVGEPHCASGVLVCKRLWWEGGVGGWIISTKPLDEG